MKDPGSKIKVGSDFSGVGAFNQALNRLGIDYEEIFACDRDKYARQTFVHNYGEPKYFPTDVYERQIPAESLDVYMTSPPCQAFSLAGKRLGKEEKRGILFFNSLEFIQENKPRFFIFENVKGLLSDNSGKTFQEWINFLGGKSVNGLPVLFPFEDSVDYHLYWSVLNAKEHGVPQNRERVFLVGIRDDIDNNFRFPKEEYLTKRLKDILECSVDKKYYLSNSRINAFLYEENYIHDKNQRYFKIKSNNSKGYELAEIGDGIRLAHPNSETARGRICNQISHTIDCTGQEGVFLESNKMKIRRLTPRECFRLMDFSETFDFSIVNDSQAYKQAGNSIVVNVLFKILKNLNL